MRTVMSSAKVIQNKTNHHEKHRIYMYGTWAYNYILLLNEGL